MKSSGEMRECPWNGCDAFVYLTGPRGKRLVKAHVINLRKGNKPCPGGGFNVDKPEADEVKKMERRGRSVR